MEPEKKYPKVKELERQVVSINGNFDSVIYLLKKEQDKNVELTTRIDQLEHCVLILANHLENKNISQILKMEIADDTPPDSPQELTED